MLVRDPVWGDISLPAWAAQILDTPEMQRLRRVRQLGLAFLVYPGAQHSRFEHSLGTAHVAQMILGALGRRDDPWADAVVAAAMLHDAAHAPFGHTFEDERPLFPRHDTPERMRGALSGKLGQAILALPFGAQVQQLLLGGDQPPLWARDIVSGSVDADLLDYLRRDAYFTGVRQQYDERVLQTLTLLGDRLGFRLTRRGRVRPDARSELLQLFRMRYILTERVYLHHTKIAAGAMLAKAVEFAAIEGMAPEDAFQLGDDALLMLLESGRYGPDAAALASRVRERRLLKRALVLGRKEVGERNLSPLQERFSPAGARRRIETEIAAMCGVAPRDVVVSCPPLPEFREMRVPTELPEGVFPLDDPPGGDPEIEVLSGRYRDLWQLAVFSRRDAENPVGDAAREYFAL